jgi:hypothetical protein
MADEPIQPVKAPWHLWLVGGASLLWNLVGAMDFVMTESKNEAYMRNFTADQLKFYYGFPLWVVAAWGIAVWGGVLGSLSLLIRRRLAVFLFLSSFICMLLTSIHNFVFSNGFQVMGGAGSLIFSAVIITVGALLLAYSRAMRNRGALC